MPGRAVSIRLRAAELVAVAPTLVRRLDRVVLAFFLLVIFLTAVHAVIARAFAGREAWIIPIAAIVGGLTPFCSCGVIPLVARLFGAGVPPAPVMAFWIASPLMDPTQFFVIAGTLGIAFAVAKALAAVGMRL